MFLFIFETVTGKNNTECFLLSIITVKFRLVKLSLVVGRHVLPLYNTSAILGFEELKQLVAPRPSSAVILDLNTAEKCKWTWPLLVFLLVPGVIAWKNWAAYGIRISLWTVEKLTDEKWVWQPVWFLALVFIENLGIKHFTIVTDREELLLTTDYNFL